MPQPSRYLREVVYPFWSSLVKQIEHYSPTQNQRHKLILFALSNQELPEESTRQPSARTHDMPVSFALNAFYADELTTWAKGCKYRGLAPQTSDQIHSIIQFLTHQAQEMNPLETLKHICLQCGYDWSEGEHKWFQL